MRTNDMLFDLADVSILLQYLYMNENNCVIVNNGLTNIEFYMDEDLTLWSINKKFPDVRPMPYDTQPYNFIGIIDRLKEQKPELTGSFKNRWDEIKEETLCNLCLNKQMRRRKL